MGAFFAPGTRALRRASFDGRSRTLLTSLLGCVLNWRREYEWTRAVEDQSAPIPREISSKLGRTIVFVQRVAKCPPCSQNAHDERDGMTPALIPCSRSAHDQNVLARRPQWDQRGCHSRKETQASLEGSIRWRVLAWVQSASRTSASSVEPRASGWAGEHVARSRGQPRPLPLADVWSRGRDGA